MGMFSKPGHGRSLGSGTPKTSSEGGWRDKAQRHPTLHQHPNGKHVVRQMFYTDSYHDTKPEAEAVLAKRQKAHDELPSQRKKFSDM